MDVGPSDKWFRLFKECHPELRWSVHQSIDACRVSQSDKYTVMRYFNLLCINLDISVYIYFFGVSNITENTVYVKPQHGMEVIITYVV